MTQISTYLRRAQSVPGIDPECGPARVLMVAANVDSRFGGVSAVLGPLCAAIRQGGDFSVSAAAFTERDENIEPLESFAPVTRYPLRGVGALYGGEPRSASGKQLADEVAQSDLVHIHGLWQEHSAYAASIARRLGKPYVISAHGMLDAWALRHKGWKKSLYLHYVERKNLSGAAALHALTSSESGDYRRITNNRQIETIPNAVEAPAKIDPDLFLSSYKEISGKTLVLFLSRLHPKKGLDLLSEAWANAALEFPDAHLVIAGPDSGNMRREIEQVLASRGLSRRVTFTGMLSGSMKWSALAAADLFVLPSRSEGLSMAALEAMAIGKPVLLTEQCHVDRLVEHDCGWQIQPDSRQLETALREFLSSPGRARFMGANGRKLIQNHYSWNVVAARMRALYGRLVRVPSPLLQSV